MYVLFRSMSHNSLTGTIPRSMAQLKKLKILKLEYNQLTGEVPQELGELENLLAVNISYNRLQGRLPSEGIFQSLEPSSLEGNLGICSPLIKGPCKMNVPKPLVLNPFAFGNQNGRQGSDDTPERFKHHRFLSVSVIISILAAVVISIGVLVISLLNISARRRLAFVDNALESCSSSSRSGASLSMGKLVWFDSKINPDNFCIVNPESFIKKANEIGGGVFGTVYKAPIGEDGSDALAVKKLVVSNMIPYPEDFDREVRVLGKLRHPNLVSLKGYYWTPKLQLLVTDFVPNGSLQTKLHERPPSSPSLSWLNRFKILLGTAKGLAYLHHSFRPPIVHYNIKPNNILLDDNLNPKISDFGLTRLLSKLDKHVMSNRFQSALGYVAPELACQSLRVNEKCDVYGFGVLILEIVTGRRPIEYGEDNVLILNEQVKIMLEEGNVLEYVDESMGEYPEDEVLPVLKLALRRPIEYGEDNVLILNEQVKIMLEEGNVLEYVDESMGEYPEDEVLPVLKLALYCFWRSCFGAGCARYCRPVHVLKESSGSDIFRRYRFGKELGRGEFGVTYECQDKENGEKVACKKISKSRLRTEIDIEDVRREVEIMRHLPIHPNIVRYKDVFEDRDAIYLVMELCQGGELFDRIVAKGHYTERAAALVTKTIVEVVQVCHKHGVIHRDLKPENFLYANRGENASLKAIDFGLSIFFEPEQRFKEIVGSPYYMAPEVLRRNYGAEVDVWSAGVILYILLCGVPPFWAETEEGIAQAIIKGDINFQRDPWPRVSDDAKYLVKGMLESNASKRFTVEQVLRSRWIQNADNVPDIPLGENVRAKIQQFSLMNKFKKKVISLVAENLPHEQIDGLKKMFNDMDKDKNGALTYEELKDGLASIGDQPLKNVCGKPNMTQTLLDITIVIPPTCQFCHPCLIQGSDLGYVFFGLKADLDHNGVLNCEEFLTIVVHLKKISNEEQLSKAFHHFDKNHNGFIEFEELKECLFDGQLDQHKEKLVHEIIIDADLDKDGRISYPEFEAMMTTGMDWKMASRQYSRAMLNAISMKMFKDQSAKSIT
ncbi:EF-hand domain pair, Serine/threonine protein kinase, striated muscle-specific [Artemisia annua]|uniref:non-specific serine/threonine protein kinase n=1 Tax=Artemisia annua TaxID=35608 RepID=A0A2U1KSE5_ARTAN|nr:EF-hand domain pair, Serine/threonine protein kinase, striated muscle-specific [Artemisia annua]